MAPHITSELWQDLGAIAYHFDLQVPKVSMFRHWLNILASNVLMESLFIFQGMVLEQNWPTWNKDFIMEKISDLKILVGICF